MVVIQARFLSPELQLASSRFNDPRESKREHSMEKPDFFFCNITLEGTSQHLSYSIPQKRVPWSFPHLLLLQVASVVSNSVRPHRRQPTRLPCPWDSPGKNTGVGCHFLLQCMKVKSESEVAQLCLTLRDPMDCSPPGSSIHGIFQARVLEWGAIVFSEWT